MIFQQRDLWLCVTLIAIVQLAAPAWAVEPAEPTGENGKPGCRYLGRLKATGPVHLGCVSG